MEDQEEGSTADGWAVRERGRGAGRKEVFGGRTEEQVLFRALWEAPESPEQESDSI